MSNDFEEFQRSISKELLIIKDRVRNLIGNTNWAEEGRYKESVLKNIISRFLPNNLSLGSGFILTKERENIIRSNIYTADLYCLIYDNWSNIGREHRNIINGFISRENIISDIEKIIKALDELKDLLNNDILIDLGNEYIDYRKI